MIPNRSGGLLADLVALRQEFPAWTFGSSAQETASGPGATYLWAKAAGQYVSARSAAELAGKIRAGAR